MLVHVYIDEKSFRADLKTKDGACLISTENAFSVLSALLEKLLEIQDG
jgi:hypothetical protein